MITVVKELLSFQEGLKYLRGWSPLVPPTSKSSAFMLQADDETFFQAARISQLLANPLAWIGMVSS